MRKYLFGAVYVIEQDYSDEEIVRDLENMKAAGYNMITLWPVGNAWLAKSSHEYIFDATLRVLDICNSLGMKCILQLFGQNQAQEFMPDAALIPEMETDDEEGINLESNNYWCNLNNPTVREYFDSYFKTAITALKDHPSVYGWDVFNEAHFRSDDTYTTVKYQQWLKSKYQDIEKLNYAWYRRYSAFSQIRPNKRRSGYSIWSSLLPSIDYEKFRSENLTEICTFLHNTAKKYDSVHPIIIDGTSSLIMGPTLLNRNNDEFATAYVPDIYGATFYPKSWGKNYRETPWTLAMYYTIPSSAARKAGKPYAVNELQTHTQSALTPGSEVNPEELRNWICMCLFNAPSIIQLWRWRPFLHGYQVTGRGLTQFDGTPNKRSAAVSKLLSIINSNMNLFGDFTVIKPAVKIAVSYSNRLAFDSLLKWNNSFWADDTEGWYRLFWESGVSVDFTNTEKLDESDYHSPIIVLPGAVQVTAKETANLIKYVEKGGILIADCRMGTLNEKAEAPREGIPGKELSQLFGFIEKDVSSGNNFTINGKSFSAPYMNQILEPDKESKILLTMEDGSPAVIEHNFGKGKTLYFNSFVGIGMKSEVSKEIQQFMSPYIEKTGCIRADKDRGVHVSYIESESHFGMLAINFADNSSNLLLRNVSLRNDETITNIMNGQSSKVIDGCVHLTLAPDSCQIYVWEKGWEIRQ